MTKTGAYSLFQIKTKNAFSHSYMTVKLSTNVPTSAVWNAIGAVLNTMLAIRLDGVSVMKHALDKTTLK